MQFNSYNFLQKISIEIQLDLDLDGVCELRDKCKGAKLFHWKTSIPFPADLNKKVVKI